MNDTHNATITYHTRNSTQSSGTIISLIRTFENDGFIIRLRVNSAVQRKRRPSIYATSPCWLLCVLSLTYQYFPLYTSFDARRHYLIVIHYALRRAPVFSVWLVNLTSAEGIYFDDTPPRIYRKKCRATAINDEWAHFYLLRSHHLSRIHITMPLGHWFSAKLRFLDI